MDQRLDRRAFLRRGAMGAGGVVIIGGGGLLAACGDDDDEDGDEATSDGGTTSETPPDYGTLDFQLSWTPYVQFAGEYVADSQGYYEDGGFSKVNFLPGGPTVAQDAVVAAGDAFICLSAPDTTAPAILDGAPLIALSATYQKNPFGITSLATTPIATPEEMIGKKVGVQPSSEATWTAFLKANDIDPAEITRVPVEEDLQPLIDGDVDAWFSFFTNEPNQLEAQGIEVEFFLLSDFNYPLVGQTHVVRTDTLEDRRDEVKAVLLADIKGWRDSLADPALGPKLTVERYGKDLDLDEAEQTAGNEDQNEIILTDETREYGILTISDELVQASLESLALGGIEIEADRLFDLSLIEEIYEEHPELVEPPA